MIRITKRGVFTLSPCLTRPHPHPQAHSNGRVTDAELELSCIMLEVVTVSQPSCVPASFPIFVNCCLCLHDD